MLENKLQSINRALIRFSHTTLILLVDTVNKEEASDPKAAIPEGTEESEDNENSENTPADEEPEEDEDGEQNENEGPSESFDEDQDENSLSENEDEPIAESKGLFKFSIYCDILDGYSNFFFSISFLTYNINEKLLSRNAISFLSSLEAVL